MVFRVKLNPVKNHPSLEIKLPETGLVRLSGHSGKGKSAIMEAIAEAKFGIGEDISPWGTTKSVAELSIPGLDITRRRGPAALVVDKSGLILKDDEAQAEINRILGYNDKEFAVAGYIRQKQENSLLSLKPAEQQKIVESLSAGKYNVESIKEKIKLRIKTQSSDLMIKKFEKEGLEKLIAESTLRHTMPLAPVFERPLAELEANVAEHSDLSIKISEKINKSRELTIQASSDYYKKLAAYNTLRDSYSTFKSETLDSIEMKKAYKQTLPVPLTIDETANLIAKKELCKLKLFFIENINKIKELGLRINTEFPESVGTQGSLFTFLDAKIASLESQKNDIDVKKATLMSELTRMQTAPKVHSCPECSTPLIIGGDTIHKAKDYPVGGYVDLIKEKQAEFAILVKQASEIQPVQQKLVIYRSQAVELKKLVAEDPYIAMNDMAAIAQEILKIEKTISDSKYSGQSHYAVDGEISSLSMQISRKEAELTSLHASLSTFGSMPALPELEAAIKSLNFEVSIMEKVKQSLEPSLDTLNSCKRQIAIYEESKKNYDKNQEYINGKKAELESLQFRVASLEAKLAATERLKERSDFAASESAEMMLEAINSAAAEWIDKMFPDSGTVIAIRSTKTTGKGDDKAQYFTEIVHKGQKVKKISNLSGGEESRAYLAFQLGLASIYNPKILMVDEGFAGLGDEDKVICIEALREVSKSRLVLVIEHGVSDALFDQTIEI